jgi:hypothetical protein
LECHIYEGEEHESMREFWGWTREERKGRYSVQYCVLLRHVVLLYSRPPGSSAHQALRARESVTIIWGDRQGVSTGGAGCVVIGDDRWGSVGRRGCTARLLLVAGGVERLVYSTVGLKRLRWKRKKGVYKRSNYEIQ